MPDTPRQHVFFVSESTGITAETFGNSLLTQFPGIRFERHYLPFTNTIEKAATLIDELTQIHRDTGRKALVFATMPDPGIDQMLAEAPCHYYEIFERFLPALAADLGTAPSRRRGHAHGLVNSHHYEARIDTVNYALNHDDAVSLKNLDDADIILIGVSRSGKTPTALYLALHYGLKAANYPLTDDDFERGRLPEAIERNLDKVVAITIDPFRLRQIREKRRPGSRYAALETCRREVAAAARLFRRYGLQPLETTNSSIEELAAGIVKRRQHRRRHTDLPFDPTAE